METCVRAVMHEVLTSLQQLHCQGLVHKDVKLADFDFTDVDSPANTVVGTDGYIAPEAYLGKVNPKSDVYSAGVIMYTLMAKKFPYSRTLFDDKPGENYVGSPKMKQIHGRLQDTKIQWSEPIW